FDLATGERRWLREVLSPVFDVLNPGAARPVAVKDGVLVRDGARGLALLAARDGKPRWQASARADVIGVPAVTGAFAVIVLERAVAAYRLDDGVAAWSVRLPKTAVTG